MSRHAPGASFPAFCDHDGELVQSVGFQARHHVIKVGGVSSLETGPGDELRCKETLRFYLNNYSWLTTKQKNRNNLDQNLKLKLQITSQEFCIVSFCHFQTKIFGKQKTLDFNEWYLKLGVCRYVGLPAHCVVARIHDFLVLGQRVVGPCDFDGVVAKNRSLNAHGRHHGNGVWYWSVWRMEKFVQINIRVYGVCEPLTQCPMV